MSGLSGSSPWRSRYARSAPEHTATNTSFTVQSSALRTALTSANGTDVQTHDRFGVNGRFRRVSGASNGRAIPGMPCLRRRDPMRAARSDR